MFTSEVVKGLAINLFKLSVDIGFLISLKSSG